MASKIISPTKSHRHLSVPGTTALDVATFTVALLQDDPLYNSGKGYKKRGKRWDEHLRGLAR
ncbi:N-terminal nucleophile aminohydrolase [Stemphylium lycopersici]|uniref:N-terminal nucleophile aminohydrolase n=1 Tax=Stemphylium lycopersici TaxID=183478 RepID=A0A364MSJ6_STELY|nr:l-asparaginase precursor [Stemphylium lycopersici]RAQ99493.1 N-terminal nucleophile aminohydrolase [Stemphylium lycopersici]RAR01579.1 N-terminal nucleophile aminohydrolase [Stemphylium lycopersici]